MSKPLVTFTLWSFNQERFIREAVKGALAQTYSPLEILFSDDCSQDRTFEIIQEEVADYKGPHRIVLNRNDYNFGIGKHGNRVMELAKGEFIVGAAGDDISLPSRTEELVKVWSKGGTYCVWSNVIIVNEDGIEDETHPGFAAVPIESWQEVVQRGRGVILGASQAYDRAVFDEFGPLPDDVVHEDYTIELRSALLGKIAYVDKRLVKYRRHSATTVLDDIDELDMLQFIKYHTSQSQWFSIDYEGWLRDIRLFLSTHPEMEDELLEAAELIRARAVFYKFKESAIKSGIMDRSRSCLRVMKRARRLGIKATAKACLLGVSPRTYYRMQRRYIRTKKWRRKLAR
jgi:glycosyltransferase involved in cell wall biosynthesis